MYLHTVRQVTKKEVENLNESAFFSKDKELVSTAYWLIFAEKMTRKPNCKLEQESTATDHHCEPSYFFDSSSPISISLQTTCFFPFQALITDIVGQISSANDLTNLGNKIFQEQDSNLNEQISKDLKVMTTRWNSLCESVINNSNR